MKPETPEEKLAALEALLFIHGEPLAEEKIETALGLQPGEGARLVAEFEERLGDAGRGLTLLSHGGRVQLVTKQRFSGLFRGFVESELSEELTPASLEALAIIAYLGPISRSRIEYQRGVSSAFILRSLLLRGLIERFPDPSHPNTYLYQPTFELFRHLGVGKREEMPEYEKFQTLLKNFEAQPAAGAVAKNSEENLAVSEEIPASEPVADTGKKE